MIMTEYDFVNAFKLSERKRLKLKLQSLEEEITIAEKSRFLKANDTTLTDLLKAKLISRRAANALMASKELRNNGISKTFVKDIEKVSMESFSEQRNVGIGVMEEIEKLAVYYNILLAY